jgi:hypothetical protein
MSITKEELSTEYETSLQIAWSETVIADLCMSPKAAFREGFSRGVLFATLILAENMEKISNKVEQASK